MPHLRSREQKPEQMWKTADRRAQKEGLRNTVYYVNGDQYTGEWHDNLQEGKGTYKWKSGAIYDGDFVSGERCGYGTYSVLVGGVYRKLFTGEWKHDKRHVRYLHTKFYGLASRLIRCFVFFRDSVRSTIPTRSTTRDNGKVTSEVVGVECTTKMVRFSKVS